MESVKNAGGQDGSNGGGGRGAGGGRGNGSNVASGSGLRHNPGISLHWSDEEQAILEEGIVEFASDSSVIRYAKIASKLPDKTIRDVALRYQWMIRQRDANRTEVDTNIPKESNNEKGT